MKLKTITIFAVALSVSCSKEGTYSSTKSATNNPETINSVNTQHTEDAEAAKPESVNAAAELKLSGLPTFCKEATGSQGSFCFSCDINADKIDRCFETEESFDFSKSCEFTKKSLTCKGKEKLTLDTRQPGEVKLVNMAALFLPLIKGLLTSKLEDGDQHKGPINGLFAFVSKHVKSVILGTTDETFTDELITEAKKYKSDLTKKQEDKIRASVKKTLDQLTEKRLKGELTGDFSKIMSAGTDAGGLSNIMALFKDLPIGLKSLGNLATINLGALAKND
jgi:hypothetical protein